MTVGAAIDVGTNSVKLLVLDHSGATLVHRTATTRLGSGLARDRRLSTEAISRTVDAIVEFDAAARAAGASDVHIVGTSACRDAANTDQLAELVRRRIDNVLRVLSSEEEAELGYLGAIGSLGSAGDPVSDDIAVIDIGGGSTEITIGRRDAPNVSLSLPFGAVYATESHLLHDPPRPEELSNLIGAVQDEIEEVARAVPSLARVGRVVGIAGTIVTIAAVELGIAHFDETALHGMVLSRAAAEDVFRTLATESIADRRHNPGLPAERSDIIVAGCCILVAVMRRLQLDEIVVSTHGLAHGLLRRVNANG